MSSYVIALVTVSVTMIAAIYMFRKRSFGQGMFFLIFPVFLLVFLVYDRGLIDRGMVVSAMAIYGVSTFAVVMYGWAKGETSNRKDNDN